MNEFGHGSHTLTSKLCHFGGPDMKKVDSGSWPQRSGFNQSPSAAGGKLARDHFVALSLLAG